MLTPGKTYRTPQSIVYNEKSLRYYGGVILMYVNVIYDM